MKTKNLMNNSMPLEKLKEILNNNSGKQINKKPPKILPMLSFNTNKMLFSYTANYSTKKNPLLILEPENLKILKLSILMKLMKSTLMENILKNNNKLKFKNNLNKISL